MKKFIPILLAAIAGMSVITHAHAGDIPLGCMSKDKLQALFKADKQAFLEQFERGTGKGLTKTSITGQKEGKSFKDGGDGYIVDGRANEACVIAKTRLIMTEDKIRVVTVHELGGQERPPEEWKQMGKWLKENREKAKADIIKRGVPPEDAEIEIQAMEVMGQNGAKPGEVIAELEYQVSAKGYKNLSRKGLN